MDVIEEWMDGWMIWRMDDRGMEGWLEERMDGWFAEWKMGGWMFRLLSASSASRLLVSDSSWDLVDCLLVWMLVWSHRASATLLLTLPLLPSPSDPPVTTLTVHSSTSSQCWCSASHTADQRCCLLSQQEALMETGAEDENVCKMSKISNTCYFSKCVKTVLSRL